MMRPLPLVLAFVVVGGCAKGHHALDAGDGNSPDLSVAVDGGAVDLNVSIDSGVDALSVSVKDGSSDDGAAADASVDQQPSLPGSPVHVAGTSGQSKSFTLTPTDPEGDSFTVAFKGCAKNQGTVVLYQDAAHTQTITLDCSVTYAAGNTPQLLNVALPITGYSSNPGISTYADGVAYNTVWLVFDDHVSPLPPSDTPVVFDVRILNNPPVLTVQGQAVSTYSATVAATDSFTPIVQATDPDFVNNSSAHMTIQAKLDTSMAPHATWNKATLQMVAAVYGTCQTGLVITDTEIDFTCSLGGVDDVLYNIQISDPGSTTTEKAVLTVSANDNGYTGQCDVPQLSTAPCPLTDQSTVTVTFTPIQ